MAGAVAGAGSTTNSDKTQSSSSSNNKLYKGVRLRKWGKWVSEIRLPNSRERIWLGSYDSPEKAARAFDAALYCLRGRHASFNFPDTPFNVPAPPPHHSLTPQEIQEIAANFANKLDPPPPQPPLVNNNNNNNQEPPSSRFGSNTATSSSSSTRYELCDQGTTQMQVDNNNGDGMNIDWTFLNVLDESSTDNLGSDNNNNNYYGLYSELEKMHSDEFLYSTPPPPLFEYNNEDEIEAADQSFLWNWNF